MSFTQYIKPLVGKSLLLSSGILIGINNYDVFKDAKEYVLSSTKKETSYSQLSYLEELVRLKK